MKKAFAQRLKLVRDSFGISQLRLANALGVQQSYVAKWEAEAYHPSEAVKKRIAQFFQVSPGWLADGTGPIFKGIVFIPMFIHMLRSGFNVDRWMNTAMLVVQDGAVMERVAVNADNEGEAVVFFARGRDLCLFMHYGLPSHGGRISSGGIKITELIERMGGWPQTGEETGPDDPGGRRRVCRLPENTFRLISPLSTLEGIEKLLSVAIPGELKEDCVQKWSGAGTRLGELVGILRREARRDLNNIDFDNSVCKFLLSIDDEDTLKGVLFLVPALMESLGLTRQDVANLSIADLRKRVLEFCKGSCVW